MTKKKQEQESQSLHLSPEQLRIQELERLLLEKEGEINSLHVTISTGFAFDPEKRYVLITENEIVRDVLPKNVLVLPEKYADLNIARNMQVMTDERSDIEDWLLGSVMNVPVTKDILSFPNGVTVLGGRRLLPAEVNQLRNEARVLRKMKLWNAMHETVIESAKKMMFENSRSYEDMRAGKTILYALDMQSNILSSVERETLDEKMKKIVKYS